MSAANCTVKHVHSRQGNCISYIIHNVLQRFRKVNICCELRENQREKKQAFVLLILERAVYKLLISTAQHYTNSKELFYV